MTRLCVCRFHARTQRAGKAHEEAELSESKHRHNRKKMEVRAQLTKPSLSKSSVLQSIYGENFFFFFEVKTITGSFGTIYMTACSQVSNSTTGESSVGAEQLHCCPNVLLGHNSCQ